MHLYKGEKATPPRPLSIRGSRQTTSFVPKYALCDVNLFGLGLTLFDYALLAEVAYFDDKSKH
jgi:hypothetical protein